MRNVTSLYLRMLHEYLMHVAQMHRSALSLGLDKTRMWANAQRDGPAEHSWRSLFNAAKFG